MGKVSGFPYYPDRRSSAHERGVVVDGGEILVGCATAAGTTDILIALGLG